MRATRIALHHPLVLLVGAGAQTIKPLLLGIGRQACRAASWTSCTREVRPSLV
jgi:hypothetical protein